jgi:RNA polymerase sigma-70 factor (ECF subfamily)
MGDGAPETEVAGWAVRASKGDRAAFERLVHATYERVYRVALRTTGNAADAEDVVQDTFVRAWSGLARVSDFGAVGGWLCSVARNVGTDRVRSSIRRRAWSIDAPTEDGSLPLRDALVAEGPLADEQLAGARAGALLADAIAALKEKHRMVLTLREIDGLSYEEIAESLGVAVGTVESRLHRAREALSKKLRHMARDLK